VAAGRDRDYSEKELPSNSSKLKNSSAVFGFIPNTYVVYEPHPGPLTARMKFELAYKDLTHPMFFARTVRGRAYNRPATIPKNGGKAKSIPSGWEPASLTALPEA